MRLCPRISGNSVRVSFYASLRKVFSLPDEVNIGKAAQRLFQIPNHMYGGHPQKYERLDLYRIEVCELLQLQDPTNNGMSKQEMVDAIRESQKKNA